MSRECAEYFYKNLLFRSYTPADGYLELREFGIKGSKPKSDWFKSVDDLISSSQGRESTYHGLLVRDQKRGKKTNAVYGDMLCLDIDAHAKGYGDSDIENCKKLALESLKLDYLLSQYAAIIDSGRGLHVYYLAPGKIFRDTWSENQKRLISYAKSVNDILGYEKIEFGKKTEERVDSVIHDANRVFRAIGSINIKCNKFCQVTEFNPITFNSDFQAMLNVDNSKRKVAIGVSGAMELLNFVPDPTKNVRCPFPQHEDSNASFRYYPDSDTYWCFKCQNGISGLDFLKAMDREDLCSSLKAEHDIRKIGGYRLDDEGSMWLEDAKEAVEKIICRFQSPQLIEQSSIIKGRRLFIALEKDAIEISDLPMNRELKKRYLQIGRTGFLSNVSDAKLPEVLVRFIEVADKIDKVVSEDNGINTFDDRDPMFRFNENIFPGTGDNVIMMPNRIGTADPTIDEEFNLNQFIEWLIADGNYTHIIALLWGVATTARDVFIDKCGLFPILVATGIRKTGKSLMAKMVCSMFGYDHNEEMDTTPFAMIKKLERYGTLPVHFDEYGGKIKEREHEEIIKDLSTNKHITRERGNISKGTDKYVIKASVIITGEHNVLDSGTVSRSIIFNVGKNRRSSQDAFYKWIGAVTEFKLVTFMTKFMQDWEHFRAWIVEQGLSRNREEVKENVILKTLNFLEEVGHIRPGLVDQEKIKEIIKVTEQYANATSPDDYTEILSEALNISYRHDMDEIRTNYFMQQATKAILFDMQNGVVCINVAELHCLYKVNTRDNKTPLSKLRAFKTAMLQSPDFIITYSRKYGELKTTDGMKETIVKARLVEPVFVRVSGYNIEMLRIPLMIKLRPMMVNQYELEQLADQTLDRLADMEIDVKDVEFNHRAKLTLI